MGSAVLLHPCLDGERVAKATAHLPFARRRAPRICPADKTQYPRDIELLVLRVARKELAAAILPIAQNRKRACPPSWAFAGSAQHIPAITASIARIRIISLPSPLVGQPRPPSARQEPVDMGAQNTVKPGPAPTRL